MCRSISRDMSILYHWAHFKKQHSSFLTDGGYQDEYAGGHECLKTGP